MEQTSNDKSQILSVTRLLTRLMIEKDTIGMNKILDDSFTLTHITGYKQFKEEWLSEIQSEGMKYYSAKEVKAEVYVDGNTARLVSQNVLDARIWGSRNNWRIQQSMRLEKRDGEWIILSSVATTF